MKIIYHTFTFTFISCFLLEFPMLANGQATNAQKAPNQIPEYFIGRFEDVIPKIIGGTTPEMKISMDCGTANGCILRMGDIPPYSVEHGISPVSPQILKAAQAALAYAKDHKDTASLPSTQWPAKKLRPLLTSAAQIESCIDVPNKRLPQGLDGELILCKLDHNPWQKPVVLMMGWTMVDHPSPKALFSSYEITPLFQENPPQESCPENSAGKTESSRLSESQRIFESAALSENGGLHHLFEFGFSSSQGVVRDMIYTEDSSIPITAVNTPQPLSVNYTVLSPLSTPFPGLRVNSQYLINGTAYPQVFPAQGQISYVGNNILEKSFAADGKTVVESILGTDYQVVQLNGLIADTQSELLNNSILGDIINPKSSSDLLDKKKVHYKDNAGWKCGSFYIKAVRKTSGDTTFADGTVIKDGTPFYNWIDAQPESNNFTIYFNKTAIDSIKAALIMPAVDATSNSDRAKNTIHVSNSADVQQLMEAINAARQECGNKRLSGELKTYLDSINCSNPHIAEAFAKANYRADLSRWFTNKRIEIAMKRDAREFTEEQAMKENQFAFNKVVIAQQNNLYLK